MFIFFAYSGGQFKEYNKYNLRIQYCIIQHVHILCSCVCVGKTRRGEKLVGKRSGTTICTLRTTIFSLHFIPENRDRIESALRRKIGKENKKQKQLYKHWKYIVARYVYRYYIVRIILSTYYVHHNACRYAIAVAAFLTIVHAREKENNRKRIKKQTLLFLHNLPAWSLRIEQTQFIVLW